MAYISFQPSDYFSTLLYSYASSPNAITGAGFAPDAVSLKSISGTSGGNNWYIANTVMGNTKTLRWNANTAEATTTDSILSFDSDGYTLGADATANCNSTGTNYVGYNWKAGTTSGLSGGTITPSSYSFNATSGFGIYKYVGTGSSGTIAHGLGAVPGMVIVKDLENTDNWITYHAGLGSGSPGGAYVNLDTTGTESTGNTSKWNGTAPTDTVFSLGDAGDTNQSSTDFIAYVFADTKGYSKFGSYIGNGNVDGPVCYTGFRPALVIIKRTNTTSNWCLWDDKRTGYNVANNALFPNLSNAETSDVEIDLLSNGFKLRNTDGAFNGSGDSYIYAAFSEFPIVSSNDIPGVAR